MFLVPRAPVERLSRSRPKTAAHLFAVAQRVLVAIEKSGFRVDGANLFMSDGEVVPRPLPFG